ncbi:MAG: carboxypeptidase-like regulatory domain-containing protein [Pirellulaceae bacterium]|nr:carboxypeptidase-like regulatory domain-containing protein [Pirellulaceae bacterium]
MSDLFKIGRLALYVIALPLAITAVVSAEAFFSYSDGIVDDSELLASNPTTIDAAFGHINHVLHIDANGGVSGQIMNRNGDGFQGSADMDVTLNSRGKVVAAATTGNDGVFHFENVTPGAYSFIATSENHVSTFGVYVLDDETPATETIQLSVAASGTNSAGVKEILNSDVQTVAYNYTPSVNEMVQIDQISRVTMSDDNTITGRIQPLLWEDQAQTFDLTGNQVYLLDGNGVVANAPVEADGSYSISGVAPGIYDFVSFGPHGAAAFSVEITEASGEPGKNVSFTNTAQDDAEDLNVILSEPVTGEDPEITVEFLVDSSQQGPGGGYGGGGGGAGGFGGDWGGIIGLALGAWVLSEAFNSSNNNAQVISPPVVIPPANSPF